MTIQQFVERLKKCGFVADDSTGWDEYRKRIADFSNLGDDWNGHGAKQPNAVVIQNSLRFLESVAAAGVSKPYFVSPNGCQSVDFDWDQGEGKNWLNVEVYEDGKMLLVCEIVGSDIEDDDEITWE